MKNRLAVAVAVALFMMLAGTGVGHAYWSTASTVSSSVKAGAIGVGQSGFSTIAAAYSSSSIADTAAITVTNSGTVTAPFTLALNAQTANTLAQAIDVWVWPVGTAGACTATSAVQGTQASWTTVPVLTGTLAPTASAIFCVRSSVTTTDIQNNQGASMTATLALSSSVGSWSATTSATAVQSVPDTTAPTQPGTPVASQTSGYSTSLAWAPATDGAGVTAYDVYRNGVLIATVASPSYLDQGLAQNTTYLYTIKARDAANNTSASSAAATVKTLPIVPTMWYRVVGQASAMCIDGNGAATTDGTQLIIYGCHGGTNQGWQFVPTTNGYYKVVARNATGSVWSITPGGGTADGAKALLWTNAGGTNQQWRIVQQSTGVYSFVAQSSGKCLDVQNNVTTAGTPLQQYTCNATTAQYFTLAAN